MSHCEFDQMVLFAAERRNKNNRICSLKAKDIGCIPFPAAKLEYSFDANIEFTSFDYTKALDIMMHRILEVAYVEATEACWNKMRNRCKYPVLCGNSIYGLDVAKIAYSIGYYIYHFGPTSFFFKRYVFELMMISILKKYIPGSHKIEIIPYRHYPYPHYIYPRSVKTRENAYAEAVADNGRAMLASFQRLAVPNFTPLEGRVEIKDVTSKECE